MQAFSDMLSSGDPTEIKQRSLVEDIDTVILVANANRNIMILHSPKNVGGTRIQSKNKVIGMLGLRTQATWVNLILNLALANCNIVVPFVNKLAACTTTKEVKDKPAQERNGSDSFEGLVIYIPAPALRNAILVLNTSNPFELILLMTTMARVFDIAPENVKTILSMAITHAGNLNAWLYGVKKDKILRHPRQRSSRVLHKPTPPMHYIGRER
jgi:hypothetical protein